MTLFDMPAELPDEHPAKWSVEVLAVIAPVLRDWGLPVHDCFGGTGERLGKLCDQLGLPFTATEIEPPFIRDRRVAAGDSTEPATYPSGQFCIATSPVYPNGDCDNFKASKPEGRRTYRAAKHRILGYDEPLDPNNMGGYGARYGAKALARHYAIADACVSWWPELAIVNISDFRMTVKKQDVTVDVVTPWRQMLERHGYTIDQEIAVSTPRNRYGANADRRVDHETVLVAHRAS